MIFWEVCFFCKILLDKDVLVCETCLELLPWVLDVCAGCGSRVVNATTYLCGYCAIEAVLTRTVVLFDYMEPIKQLIWLLKFKGITRAADFFCRLFNAKLQSNPDLMPAIFLPVPLSKERLRSRGYSQSYELAKRLVGAPCRQLVRKIRHTPMQSKLNTVARLTNLKNAFELSAPVNDLHITIVDDVLTTGATIREIAYLLKEHGAARVDALVIAKS